MPLADIDICNMALGHLAISRTIAALTDKTTEALACARFYAQTRDEVLRDFPWSFARRIVGLTLVTDFTSTTPREWDYAYRVPSDLLLARRVLNDVSRVETRQGRIPFILGADEQGGLLYTDKVNAQLEYTVALTSPTYFTPDFAQSVALLLAAYIAPQITGGDQFKLGDRAFQLYQARKSAAQMNDLAQRQDDMPADSELVNARTGALDPHTFAGGYGDCR